MALAYLTSSTLINAVKVQGMIPTSQSTFSDDDFLSIANQEIKIGMVPSILMYHEEFFAVDSADIPVVANQSNYAIPYRATGNKFRELFYKDTNGNLQSMSRVSPDDRAIYQSGNQNGSGFFYLKGNDVVLMPDVGSNPTGSLMFTYYMRPNELVSESRVGTITSISVDTATDMTTFTLNVVPQNLTSFVQDGVTLTGFSTNAKLDLLQRKSGHKTIAFDISPTNLDTTNKTLTFNTSDLGSGVVVGDIIAFAGECIIPQIPSDLHTVLVQRVIQRVMQALGDAAGLASSTGKLAEMEKNIGFLVDNRSEGSPQKAVSRGTLQAAKINRRW